ncbi:four-helix bundle copper-binding protein [Clostridium botulinum]|uniref:Ferredoxin n=1 Tax=Clostridium botulinum C/D str. DC5 TaxID=1443128 RepID=A0A0A0IKG1_CLOBO|nr:four-helix bundle copper-binding protein [Clostridium botulinum]KEI00922.1 ferredoxin [Clostridium botulinum C/D str. BKT75002]KEI11088.1 ferredoxin [Clostridium botulinum C/D str. BKT2873]KGM94097.1 ferredoxin [Clostridium botulinum D str. CCUG 7971]KGN00056.1 ferredoxin [Clostridium botulinum C/D str. DC5]KOC50591.1 ferredoxin [Clostridium botulinum]
MGNVVSNQKYQTCIDICLECSEVCEWCSNCCLNEPDPKAMVCCIKLDSDCADMCTLAAKFMARDSQFAKQLCSLCAQICKCCGEECAKHPNDHCKNCANICNRCATECENMSK